MSYKFAEGVNYQNSYVAKSRFMAMVLWFFLGGFSAHNFYLGRTDIAVYQIALNVLVVMMLMIGGDFAGIIALIAIAAVVIWYLFDFAIILRETS